MLAADGPHTGRRPPAALELCGPDALGETDPRLLCPGFHRTDVWLLTASIWITERVSGLIPDVRLGGREAGKGDRRPKWLAGL